MTGASLGVFGGARRVGLTSRDLGALIARARLRWRRAAAILRAAPSNCVRERQLRDFNLTQRRA